MLRCLWAQQCCNGRTNVSVTLRVSGQPVGRFRRLMMICEDIEELEKP